MTLVILPFGHRADDTVKNILSPYWSGTTTERDKEYLDLDCLEALVPDSVNAEDFQENPAKHIREVADFSGEELGYDKDGIFMFQHFNPNTLFDYYLMGGRWDNSLPNGKNIDTIPEDTKYKVPDKNIPFFLFEPDGEYILKGYSKGEREWFVEVQAKLAEYSGYDFALVDLHL
jgi:hypothetical protein